MEPSLAELVARGDVNPFTLCPMIDILPQFRPETSGCVLNPDLVRHNGLPITHYLST